MTPRQSVFGVYWGCVQCFSSLIQTEREDVIHKQGRGWRHIICTLWIVPVFRCIQSGQDSMGTAICQTQRFCFTQMFLITSAVKFAACLSRWEIYIGQSVTILFIVFFCFFFIQLLLFFVLNLKFMLLNLYLFLMSDLLLVLRYVLEISKKNDGFIKMPTSWHPQELFFEWNSKSSPLVKGETHRKMVIINHFERDVRLGRSRLHNVENRRHQSLYVTFTETGRSYGKDRWEPWMPLKHIISLFVLH